MTDNAANPRQVNGVDGGLRRVIGRRVLLLFVVGDVLGYGSCRS